MRPESTARRRYEVKTNLDRDNNRHECRGGDAPPDTAARENCIAANVNPKIQDSTYFVRQITQMAGCLPFAIGRAGFRTNCVE